MTKEEETKKVVPQRQSVHVVFFSCGNCGEEVEYIQFCPDCGKPMRVIDVVEKFGEESEELIKKIEDRLAKDTSHTQEKEFTEIVDEIEPEIVTIDESVQEEDAVVAEGIDTLDDIFPDDDSDVDSKVIKPDANLSDLDDIVAELDKEDDDFSLDDFGDDGLPEL
jgi:hypothetical protein